MRFGGACADFGVLTVLTGLFLSLSYPSAYHFLEENLMLLYL